MTKKDRVAIVVSVIYAFVPLFGMANGEDGAFLFVLPIVIYWGYRFIKGDISFLGKNNGKP